MKILVTGASGFIGSAFVRMLARRNFDGHSVRAVVRHTDARNMRRLNDFSDVVMAQRTNRLQLINMDLSNYDDMSGLCEGVDWVVHFAARTFVDHAIKDPKPFVQANVIGTLNLLEDARRYSVKRYIQVSTDEVYGAILHGAYDEKSPLNPTNSYAASKAGADALAIAYAHTHKLHTTITRTENNYGEMQHPQKVFPAFVAAFLRGDKLPVYGDGLHVRQWLWVDDHCEAIYKLLIEPTLNPGEVFHIAGNQELTNIELANKILIALGVAPANCSQHIRYVPDHNIRPGHDRRYALNCDKIKKTINWSPAVSLDEGIGRAVRWYLEHPWWLL